MIQSEKRKLERVKEEITELLHLAQDQATKSEMVDTLGELLEANGYQGFTQGQKQGYRIAEIENKNLYN